MNCTLLIVDDSSVIRRQLASALEAKGARVLQAENGSEALWRAREHNVDLVLTDIHMPVMDGLQLIQKLRAQEQYARVPIFVLTTDASALRIEEGKKAGATAWILKPVNADLMWNAIEKMLLGKQRHPVADHAKAASQRSGK